MFECNAEKDNRVPIKGTLKKALNNKQPCIAALLFGIPLSWVFIPSTLAGSADNGFALEEVIVTAERRETDLQSTPIAITAMSGDFLEERKLDSFKDIGMQVPGFAFVSNGKGGAQPSMRGAYTPIFSPGVDQSFVMFVDDVYMAEIQDFDLSILDVERIEVLRGPQGTLFGKNVTGGVMRVITREPSEELRGMISASYGRFDRVEGRSTVSGPILEDQLFGLLTVGAHHSDGYMKNDFFDSGEADVGLETNVNTGEAIESKYAGEENKFAVGAKLKYVPSDDLDILLSVNYSEENSGNEPRILLGATPGLVMLADRPVNMEPAIASVDEPGFYDQERFGVSARGRWSNDFGTLTTVTSFRTSAMDKMLDLDATPLPLAHQRDLIDSEQFTQEFRWNGNAFNDRLDYVVGIYYLRRETEETDLRFSDTSACASTITGPMDVANAGNALFTLLEIAAPAPDASWTNCAFALATVATNAFVVGAPVFRLGPTSIGISQSVETDSYAGFLQGTYAITDSFNITVGGRYTWEEKSSVTSRSGDFHLSFLPAGPFSAVDSEDSWGALTPRLTLDYQLTDEAFVYTTISKGFKAGGFTGDGATAADAGLILEPETVWNYEVGAKTRWFDGRMQANVTGYIAKYDNLQIAQFTPSLDYVLTNAGKAEAKGVEAELSVLPSPGLTLSVNYAFTDGTYTDFDLTAQGGGDFTGNQLQETARNSLNVSARYLFELGSGSTVSVYADLQKKSKIYHDPANTELAAGELDSMVNAGIVMASVDEQWILSIWGKNLTDERASVLSAFNGTSFLGTFAQSAVAAGDPSQAIMVGGVTRPRTWGVTITRNF